MQPDDERQERISRQTFLLGLGVVGVVLAALPYLPFQDVPNHVQLLRLDRALGDAAHDPVFTRPDATPLGYSLYIWWSRLTARMLSPEAAIRVVIVASSLGLPVAAARLAHALRGPTWVAGTLVLPLALAWPVRVGLVPYALALPLVLAGAAAAVGVVERPTRARAVALAAWGAASYLAHAYAFGWLGLLAALAWATLGRWRLRALLALAAAFAPALALAARDTHLHVFDPIAETGATLLHAPLWFRPLALALAHVVTRSYGIPGPATMLLYLPLFGVLGACFAQLALARADAEHARARRFLLLAALAGTLGTLAIPESKGLVFLLGSRTTVIGVALASVLAAFALPAHRATFRAWAVGAVAISLGGALGDVITRARGVEAVVGAKPPYALAGRFLTAQVADCSTASSIEWGGYDSIRHVWAYALGQGGVTPYLFAASRYQPVWYRGDVFQRELFGPHEHPLNENETPLDPRACLDLARARLVGATGYPGYDGVIVTHAPGKLEGAAAGLPVSIVRDVAPGIALVTASAASRSRLYVDFGVLPAWPYLRSGFASDERVDGRTVVWSDGPTSRLEFELDPVDAPYQLTLHVKAVAPESVALTLDGEPLSTLEVPPTWRLLRTTIDRRRLAAGRHTLELAYSRTVRPRDTVPGATDGRALGVLFDELLLAPVTDRAELDLGTPEVRTALLAGFGPDLLQDGRSIVRALGPTSRAEVFLAPAKAPYRVVILAGSTAPRTAQLIVNGRSVGTVHAARDWTPSVTELDDGVLRDGSNELELASDPADASGPPLVLDRIVVEPFVPESARAAVGTGAAASPGARPAPLRPWSKLELGRPSVRASLESGFSTDEIVEGRPAVWSEGPSSTFTAHLQPITAPYTLVVTARGFAPVAPQRIMVSVNDQSIGSLPLQRAWARMALAIPANALVVGENRVTLYYERIGRPADFEPGSADARPIACLFREIYVGPDAAVDDAGAIPDAGP